MRGKDVVNWVNSIGLYIPFEYDDIIGNINILDCPKRGYITIEYNTKHHIIKTDYILNCNLGKIVGKKDASFKYNIGDIVDCEDISYRITNREKVRKTYSNGKSDETRYYDCICLKCNSEVRKAERDFERRSGCPVCGKSKRVVVSGVNSIRDEAPELIKFLVNESDADVNFKSSTKKVAVKCPDCGTILKKKIKLNALYSSKSIKCKCGDSMSKSEKIIYSVLEQCGVNFTTEYSPDWAGKFRYDFYVPNYNLIIEADGEQHYKFSPKFHKNKTMEEVIEIDKLKTSMCLKNGIDIIRINCKDVDVVKILSQLEDSELCSFLDFEKIDIEKCEEDSVLNRVKEFFYNYKSNNMLTTSDMCSVLRISTKTANKYIKNAIKYGWITIEDSFNMKER